MLLRTLGLILPVIALSACDPSYKPRPQPEPEPKKSGISISGYGRVGVSTLK